MSTVLEFDGVSKRYSGLTSRQERWALRDFNLRIEAGEIVGFLGPNGAGKTTAIHLALGLAFPTSGSGKVFGQPFGDSNSRKRIGFLSEAPAFYHHSARKVVRMSGVLNGVRDPELRDKANLLLNRVGLREDADRSVGKFSRGMLQRVGIAQALINDPELLILDEPTSALDPISKLHVRELLLEAHARGRTVFLSSHQLSEVELICERLVFVHNGAVIAAGHTRDFLETADEFVITAEHLSVPPPTAADVRKVQDRTEFTVRASEQRAAIEYIWAARATLISVTPKTRSLEKIFLSLMKCGEADTHQPQ
jgi:ABC-2 type transport system ATP-binding protein